jgi:hypothetical protein
MWSIPIMTVEERVIAVDLADGVQWSDQQLINWLALSGYEARTVQRQPVIGFPTRPRPPLPHPIPNRCPRPPPARPLKNRRAKKSTQVCNSA